MLLVAQPPDGGVHRHVASLVELLGARGFEVIVAGPPAYADLGAAHVELALDRAPDPRRDPALARRLGALVRGLQPAVVHAHSSKAGALARLTRAAGAPVVYTPHGYAFAGHFESGARRALYRAIERGLAPMTDLTLCVCEDERRLASAVGAGARTVVVHNGVAAPAPGVEADPRVAALAAEGPVVGAVIGLRPGKGAETFVDAAALVARKHPSARFAIAGDGPMRAELAERARRAGLGERLVLLGATDGAQPLLAGTSIAVSASWAESFPYAVLEAMAAGVAVVATAVGGTAEAFEDGRSGLLVAPRDATALAASIGLLLAEPARRRALAEAGRAHVTQRFSMDAMGDGVAAAYRSVA